MTGGWGSFTEAKEAGESGEVGVGEERNTRRVIGSGSRGRVVIPREPQEVGAGEGHNTRIRGAAFQVLHLQEWDCFSRNPPSPLLVFKANQKIPESTVFCACLTSLKRFERRLCSNLFRLPVSPKPPAWEGA